MDHTQDWGMESVPLQEDRTELLPRQRLWSLSSVPAGASPSKQFSPGTLLYSPLVLAPREISEIELVSGVVR